jgi:lysophospholipase L1-like esterase
MPLGDSITDGVPVDGGYRKPLYDRLAAAGLAVRFVGSASDNSGCLPDGQKNHEGHSGYTIASGKGRTGIAENLDAWLGVGGADPDVILLMIGTNDAYDGDPKLGFDPSRSIAHRLNAILVKITRLKPRAQVLVAQITPMSKATVGEAVCVRVAAYNRSVAAVVAKLRAQGKKVRCVDMYAAIDPATDLSDGVHPNKKGYEKMANAWFRAIQTVVPSSRSSARTALSLWAVAPAFAAGFVLWRSSRGGRRIAARLTLGCMLAVCMAVGGCGAGKRAEAPRFPVHGTVTLDGKPLAEGTIYFKTVATGAIDSMEIRDGKFEGKTEAGDRRVEITSYDVQPPKANDPMKTEIKKSRIATRFNIESKLTATVAPDAAKNEFKFETSSR